MFIIIPQQMIKAVIIHLLIAFVSTQTFPCLNVPNTNLAISSASASIQSISRVIISGSVSFTWMNPNQKQTAILTIGNWSSLSTNNSLLLLNCLGLQINMFSLTIGNNQQGVIYSSLAGGNQYIFAQKDTANSNFQVQVTSRTANTFTITCQLQQGNYNDMTNKTCIGVCPNNGVTFATLNDGFILTNQLVCGTPNLLVGLVLVCFGLIF